MSMIFIKNIPFTPFANALDIHFGNMWMHTP